MDVTWGCVARDVDKGVSEAMMQNHQRAKRRSRMRGAVMVEYAFLLTFVVVPGALGIMIAGAKLRQQYVDTRTQVLAPTP